jgi:predicted nucleotidyltransferase
MRLKQIERAAILKTIRRRDAEAFVYLFGSRTRDDARGGDIDLLAVSRVPLERERHQILDELNDELGEQKIDLVITSPALENVFARMLIETRRAIPL